MCPVGESGAGRGYHQPVLVAKVVAALRCRPGGWYVDGTVGDGGHALAILAASQPDGRLVAMDRDGQALVRAKERLGEEAARVVWVHEDYRNLKAVLRREGLVGVDGVLFDLGVSSSQLEDASRGFSFLRDGPLDMRFDRRGSLTAAWVVNRWSEAELARIFALYGEERWSRRVAAAIVAARRKKPLERTRELAQVVAEAIPRRYHPRRIHPATRVFQALRIVVNDELRGLDGAIEAAVDCLLPGGRLCVIAYHSLEDRIVKEALRRLSGRCVCPPGTPVCECGHREVVKVLTPKPVTPGAEERQANPRSRSARLRVAERKG